MCGIVGGAGDMKAFQEDMVKQLLMLDTQRGPHSTGLLSVHKEFGDAMVVKAVGTPWDLFEHSKFQDLNKRPHKVLLGHNRWATRGAVTAKNSHPFTHRHIVGVHNGTLRAQYHLKDYLKFEVDSENIMYNIGEEGIDTTASKLDGAYCLVWFNVQDQTLNFLRNNERPLFIAGEDGGNNIFWASEEWMLHIAAMKSRIKIKKPEALPVDTLTIYKVNKGGGLELSADSGKTLTGYKYKWAGDGYDDYYVGGNRGNVTSINSGNKKNRMKVVFEISGEVGGNPNNAYLYTQGQIVSGPKEGEHVRIYAYNKSELRKKLFESPHFFVGTLMSSYTELVKGRWEKINTLSVQDIEEVAGEGDRPPILMNNRIVSKLVFDAVCNNGCMFCANKVDESKAPFYFFDEKENNFLCEDCVKEPESIDYFKEATK